MITKHLLRADRQRQIPPSFSWVDHRLIRHQHLKACDHRAWALYLFLLTVGPYVVATVVPSWLAATVDPDAAMRS